MDLQKEIFKDFSESPLSSKVAMFNNQAQQHKNSQLLNPFSNADGRSSPKPTFSKDEYGKPLAGSLTEMRGQKANMHVLKEMLELCQIINSEGYPVKDEPNMRVIPFGELFNIYNYISDKVVGILLRARKHKLVEFEGEMLFQRRDDNVPIFLLRPILSIRRELEAKIDDIKRAGSPAPPQSTSVLMDKAAHEQKLKELAVPGNKKQNSKSRSASPAVKTPAASPAPTGAPSPTLVKPPTPTATPSPTPLNNIAPVVIVDSAAIAAEAVAPKVIKPKAEIATPIPAIVMTATSTEAILNSTIINKPELEASVPQKLEETIKAQNVDITAEPAAVPTVPAATTSSEQVASVEAPIANTETNTSENLAVTPINETAVNAPEELPIVVIEATGVYVRKTSTASEVNTDAVITGEPIVETADAPLPEI